RAPTESSPHTRSRIYVGNHHAAVRRAELRVGGMAKELTGRTALVTGAGSGIGAACARRLAAEGAKVLVVDRAAEPAAKVAAEVGGVAVVADLTDPGFVAALPDEPVDVVVNNAGFQHVAPIEEFPPEVFSAILKVMVEAPFL